MSIKQTFGDGPAEPSNVEAARWRELIEDARRDRVSLGDKIAAAFARLMRVLRGSR